LEGVKMSYGIEIKNQNNETLVDGINKLPLLHEKITIDTSAQGGGIVEFTPTNKTPFILAFFENCTIYIDALRQDNNNNFYGVDVAVIETGGQAEIYVYII
jgi:hypothetical protein